MSRITYLDNARGLLWALQILHRLPSCLPNESQGWAIAAPAHSGVWVPHGLAPNLGPIACGPGVGNEGLIGDDPQTYAVEAEMLNHPLYRAGGVDSAPSRPALGAMPNWSYLLARTASTCC